MVFRRLMFSFFLLSSVLFLSPVSVNAATTYIPSCYCFCTGKDGAFPINAQGDEISSKDGSANVEGKDQIPPAKCEEFCQGKHSAHVSVCAQKYEQFPSNNRLCFTQKQCDLENEKGEALGVWDGLKGSKFQPPECMKGMFYCYPHTEKANVKLSIPIGNLGLSADLGQYVGALYQWMLAGGAVIAVVMILIGGFQYVLGAGMKGQAEKGKERIKNGVIGLVLLLCVVLISKVINPQLLKMEVPRLPLIRTLELGTDKTCEKYISEGYDVVPQEPTAEKVCGKWGLVKSKAEKEVLAGTTCYYTGGCPDDDICRVVPNGGPTCVDCMYMVEGNKYGVTPSSSFCSSLTTPISKTSNGFPFQWRCGWTKDKDFHKGIVPKALKSGSCVAIKINCDEVTDCDGYEHLTVMNGTTGENNQPLEDIVNFSAFEFGTKDLSCGLGGCGNFDLATICHENPCSKLLGGKVGTNCQASQGALGFTDECDPIGSSKF
ncbi:MAG: pilin [Patescibacteria group bacterium]